jgi:hypothetical protein
MCIVEVASFHNRQSSRQRRPGHTSGLVGIIRRKRTYVERNLIQEKNGWELRATIWKKKSPWRLQKTCFLRLLLSILNHLFLKRLNDFLLSQQKVLDMRRAHFGACNNITVYRVQLVSFFVLFFGFDWILYYKLYKRMCVRSLYSINYLLWLWILAVRMKAEIESLDSGRWRRLPFFNKIL